MNKFGEFDLIEQYFKRPVPNSILGVGDDCALLPLTLGHKFAVSTDMLIEGRHFLPNTDPVSLGYKSLAVNLSDLAAMGAKPVGCTLALAIPEIDHDWLAGFASGFHDLSQTSKCYLIGGDTTRSLAGITISVTVIGEVRRNHALRRDNAKLGDDIWLSGDLGGAYIALQLALGNIAKDTKRYNLLKHYLEKPEPRLALGKNLVGVANSAIDISDGLLQDLGHILKSSSCGAEINLDKLPIANDIADMDKSLINEAILAGGDVYELCFTAKPRRREQIQAIAKKIGVPVHRIGTIVKGENCVVLDAQAQPVEFTQKGFDHFAI